MSELGFLEDPQKKPELRRVRLPKSRQHPAFRFIFDIVFIVATALVLSLLFKTFIVRSFFIPSGSMEQTLMVNDRIVVNELTPNFLGINHGDVIVFRDPGGWLGESKPKSTNSLVEIWDWFLSAFGITAPDSDQHLVKRVIGTPGDHVVCCDLKGRLKINGKSISEPYIADGVKPSELEFDVLVPKDSYWVMGDNRPNSADSRFHTSLPSSGFVAKSFVVGRAILVSYPFSRWSWLDNYPNVFKNVPKP